MRQNTILRTKTLDLDSLQMDTSKCEGYLWYSFETAPRVFINEQLAIDQQKKINMFVVEGQLYDGKNSISIRYIDGNYMIARTEISPEDIYEGNENIRKLTFLPNRMEGKGISKLKFIQNWESEADPMCEGMKVLHPTALAFVGFEIIR